MCFLHSSLARLAWAKSANEASKNRVLEKAPVRMPFVVNLTGAWILKKYLFQQIFANYKCVFKKETNDFEASKSGLQLKAPVRLKIFLILLVLLEKSDFEEWVYTSDSCKNRNDGCLTISC